MAVAPAAVAQIPRPLDQTGSMAFGQQAGPPASASQMRELSTLLEAVGHGDFRDARGPMGFTQRQAAGKFTRDEATGFIDRLQEAEFDRNAVAEPPLAPDRPGQAMLQMPSGQLAGELRRRGWTVIEP